MSKPKKHETLKQLEAFELYVVKRDLRGVARELGVGKSAVRNWAKNFDWKTRVRARDVGIARKLARKTDTSIVSVKARYHSMIHKIVEALCKHHLGKDLKSLRHPEKTTLTDLERLVRLDLMLLGEPDLVARLETGRARELDTALSQLSPAELRALVGMAKQQSARTVKGELISSTEVKNGKEKPATESQPGEVGSSPAES